MIVTTTLTTVIMINTMIMATMMTTVMLTVDLVFTKISVDDFGLSRCSLLSFSASSSFCFWNTSDYKRLFRKQACRTKPLASLHLNVIL